MLTKLLGKDKTQLHYKTLDLQDLKKRVIVKGEW